MFELTIKYFENLRIQIGTSSWDGTRYKSLHFLKTFEILCLLLELTNLSNHNLYPTTIRFYCAICCCIFAPLRF
jgi:hypothetical protein